LAERLAADKHSSLFVQSVSDEEKSFIPLAADKNGFQSKVSFCRQIFFFVIGDKLK
jgi:hypothetical protein